MLTVNRSFRLLSALILATSLAVACDRLESRSRVAATPPPPPRAQAATPAAIEEGVAPPAAASAAVLPGADAFSDAIVTARIRASLATDPAMAGSDVSVNADRGVVHLTGNVVSQEQSAIASSHAQRQDGVMRIESHLSVNQQ